jgi:hypothetical protein
MHRASRSERHLQWRDTGKYHTILASYTLSYLVCSLHRFLLFWPVDTVALAEYLPSPLVKLSTLLPRIQLWELYDVYAIVYRPRHYEGKEVLPQSVFHDPGGYGRSIYQNDNACRARYGHDEQSVICLLSEGCRT